jgi:hypothetical protein
LRRADRKRCARRGARQVEAFFLAAGLAATGLCARRVTAVFVFVLREDLLAASAGGKRPRRRSLGFEPADCFDTFALGIPAVSPVLSCSPVLSDDFGLLYRHNKRALFPVPLWRRDGS